MTIKLLDEVGAAICCRYLQKRNKLAFVEYSKGGIGLLDMVNSSSTVVIFVLDCQGSKHN